MTQAQEVMIYLDQLIQRAGLEHTEKEQAQLKRLRDRNIEPFGYTFQTPYR